MTFSFDYVAKTSQGKEIKDHVEVQAGNQETARRKAIEMLNVQKLIVKKLTLNSQENTGGSYDDGDTTYGPGDEAGV